MVMATSYLSSVTKQFEYYKLLAEKAMGQLPDEALFWQYNEESNSIAVILNHMVGNMLSRFTDFLTTDGEKPWRDRDAEFEYKFSSRDEVMGYWNKGWNCLLGTLSTLRDDNLEDVIYIRNDGHTVIEALNRQLAHYSYHIGQIVYIAKMVSNEKWESLSIPRNKSKDFNTTKFSQEKAKRHFTDDL
jgi:hypothetical protein